VCRSGGTDIRGLEAGRFIPGVLIHALGRGRDHRLTVRAPAAAVEDRQGDENEDDDPPGSCAPRDHRKMAS